VGESAEKEHDSEDVGGDHHDAAPTTFMVDGLGYLATMAGQQEACTASR